MWADHQARGRAFGAARLELHVQRGAVLDAEERRRQLASGAGEEAMSRAKEYFEALRALGRKGIAEGMTDAVRAEAERVDALMQALTPEDHAEVERLADVEDDGDEA